MLGRAAEGFQESARTDVSLQGKHGSCGQADHRG